MQILKIVATVVMMGSLLGCAAGLSTFEKRELKAFESRGLKVTEKDETTATLLGLLPGGGSFYTGNPGYGVVNFLFWPLTIFWDPVSGLNGAQSINYSATKFRINRLLEDDLAALDTKLMSKEISTKRYAVERRKVEKKYKPY